LVLRFQISSPHEGANDASLMAYGIALGENAFDDYFNQYSTAYPLFSTIGGLTYFDLPEDYFTVNLEITSLPQVNIDCLDNLEGSLSTTLYALDPGSDGDSSSISLYDDTYSIPVELEVSFSIPRNM
jgi:hypothetical protein